MFLAPYLRTSRSPSWPFLFLNVEFCEICYSCARYFCHICCSIFSHSRTILVTFAIFSNCEHFSKPFLSFSLSKCSILLNLLFLLFLLNLLLNLFTREEKFLLLLRFLRNLRTSRSPSWPFLFLNVEFCEICCSCYFCHYLLLNLFTLEEKFLLLLRFLRNLRTSQSPSWLFLFLSVVFCSIC